MFVKYFRDERLECQVLFKTLEKLTGEFPDLVIRTFETENGYVSVFKEEGDIKTIPTLKFISETKGLVSVLEHFPTEEEIISILN